jgi:hypothetical protein
MMTQIRASSFFSVTGSRRVKVNIHERLPRPPQLLRPADEEGCLASHAGCTRSTVTSGEDEQRRRGGGEWRAMRAQSRGRERESGAVKKMDLGSNRAVIR